MILSYKDYLLHGIEAEGLPRKIAENNPWKIGYLSNKFSKFYWGILVGDTLKNLSVQVQ